MRKIIFPSIVAILLIAGFTGILSTKFFNNIPTKKNVIIDTDMGSDGWMAILYLLKQPNIDVRGIILDGNGVSFLPVAKENLKRILALAKYNKPLIIGEGRTYNLIGNKRLPDEFRKSPSELLNMNLPEYPVNNLDIMPARFAYKKLLKNSEKPVSILTIGPLTTLANVLHQNPRLKQNIQRIVMLGGAINVPGNVDEIMPKTNNNTAEVNFYLDPLAAQIILQSGVPITLIPLDVTNQVPLNTNILTKFDKYPNNPITTFLTRLLERNYFSNNDIMYYFWDPLAAGILAHPNYVVTRPMSLSVETKVSQTWGKIQRHDQTGHTVDVALSVSAEAFINDFVATLAKTSAKSSS